jgi:tRNA threonylcarbamoyl adenosine modification protein (Sua5/YciO/YrdC/YwlC family)
MCSDLKNISEYGHVGNTAYRLMRKCLPGPYTFVLSGTKLVPRIMLTHQKTVGIRVPDHPICTDLIQALGNPVLNTTALLNKNTKPPVDGYDVNEMFGNQVDLVIEGGEIIPEPSTVVSLIDDYPEILREGKGDLSLFV